MYSEQTFAFATGFIRTANWAGFQSALIVGAAVALWKESRWRWKMAAWLLLSLVGGRGGLAIFPALLLSTAARDGAARCTRLHASWVDAAWIMLALLLIPLIRFGPRYVTLANDLAHGRQSNWSDLALNQDSKAVSDQIGRTGHHRPRRKRYWSGAIGRMFSRTPECPRAAAFSIRNRSPAYWPTGISPPHSPSHREWAARNRRELIASDPTWIVDGLGPLNPALAITNFPDLREWLG